MIGLICAILSASLQSDTTVERPDGFLLTAIAVLVLVLESYIFSFRLRRGNYIIDGVVKKSARPFWIKPGMVVETLPEICVGH
jgi:hypothetical protein